ncbi:MAG: DNA polymerase I [Selenomonadaceae bacterium]|nr:DNA polymerase I [Selenomonadaceae bacterium]
MFYRAFYALPPTLSSADGTPTGGIFGFITMFLKLCKELQPDAVAIALDVGKKTFRNDIDGNYKGTRPPTPKELSSQLPLLSEFADALGIKNIGVENYEADDIIGTLAAQASQRNFEVVIATGDQDALQLIDHDVSVRLIKGINNHHSIDRDAFIDEYGFMPERFADYKALAGDQSDNIPGVKGIGEKTAKRLLVQFSTVENLYNNIGLIEPKSVRRKLNDGRDNAFLSKRLALIDRNVPGVEFEPEAFGIEPNFQCVDEFCDRLNLKISKAKIHEQFDDDLFSDNDYEKEILPPHAIELPFVYNLKGIYHAGIDLQSNELYDVELMNYLLEPGSRITTLRPSLTDVGNNMLERLRADHLIELYDRIELPLVKVLADMEDRGVYVNVERLDRKAQEMSERIAALEQKIFELADQKFNVNSPKQLSDVLFNRLKLKPVKRTKSGFSTDAAVLFELRGQHPIIEVLLECRALSKLKSTFLDGIKPLIDPKTHRVHTHFNQTVTTTGRLSSSDPNLQNIPIRTTEGREIRTLFEAGDGFDYLLSADYSQIELRLLAHMSGDENLIDAFNRGQDVHARTASEVFGLPLEEITPELRRKAKAVNFGIIYGLSDYGLSKGLNISRKEAAEYIEKYFARYPSVKKYLDGTIEAARRDGYVTTMFGRRRSLPSINSRNYNVRALAERMAMNTPIQGTAADIIKLAMIETEKNLSGLSSRMLLQVHDELVIEVVEGELERVKEIVRRAMEGAADLKVKLEVDVAVGKNWLEAK